MLYFSNVCEVTLVQTLKREIFLVLTTCPKLKLNLIGSFMGIYNFIRISAILLTILGEIKLEVPNITELPVFFFVLFF